MTRTYANCCTYLVSWNRTAYVRMCNWKLCVGNFELICTCFIIVNIRNGWKFTTASARTSQLDVKLWFEIKMELNCEGGGMPTLSFTQTLSSVLITSIYICLYNKGATNKWFVLKHVQVWLKNIATTHILKKSRMQHF